MSKFNSSSYYPLQMVCKSAPKNALFGPTTKPHEHDCIYPDDDVPLNSTIIWLPKLHKSVSLESYLKAQRENDAEALEKITSLGIPLGIDFGITGA